MIELPEYRTWCMHCTLEIPKDRKHRNAVTCSQECASNMRKEKRRYFHALRKQQYQAGLIAKIEKMSPETGHAHSA
jgi:predicted nucleic acid-binding Zn ribbon protein